MEPDRVEMSVGSGMVNGDHSTNGISTNGSSSNTKALTNPASAERQSKSDAPPHTNGEAVVVKREAEGDGATSGSILHDAPQEWLEILSSEFYLPMATLIDRSAQSCWNDLSDLVEKLAAMSVQMQSTQNAGALSNDQSKTNLDKKDIILNFAKHHKDRFIKLLVLLQWSKRSEDVRKTIELNLWLQQRRQAFNNATSTVAAMMRGLADSQVPNPDLQTAAEVLATGNVSSMPKLDYIPKAQLTIKQMIRLLRRLDVILCARMTLMDNLPPQLSKYHVHDGRTTFHVDHEFSFDVSVMSEDLDAKFGMVDFCFCFSPSPSVPDHLHDEIIYLANSALDKDGFEGAYNFLHDLTLSYKLNEFVKQARNLAQGLWSGQLRVEVLRRTLVIQYWQQGAISKSWLEIGIHSGKRLDSPERLQPIPTLRLRWMREGKLIDDHDINVDLQHLSIESILRQAIAQHVNYLFDSIYESLMSAAPYDIAELELSQSASTTNPADCALEVQLSKTDILHVSFEPIGGTLILTPANDKASRLQTNLARSTRIVDDFVSQVANLRSSIAESNLMRSLPNSQWQRLDGIRMPLSEAEKLFGQAATRVSFLRLQHWLQHWMLVVTQSTSGDHWWLVQNVQPNDILSSRVIEIVKSHPLYHLGSPSPGYLERLAEFTTGTIALQCNAEYLTKKKIAWRLPSLSTFTGDTRLPALQFVHHTARQPLRKLDKLARTKRKDIHLTRLGTGAAVSLTYHGIEHGTKKVVMVARTAINAEVSVLKTLAQSELHESVTIVPEKQQVMIKMISDAGSPIINDLESMLSHLENIVACAASIKNSTEHTLQSLSLSMIRIQYHTAPDLSLAISFGKRSNGLSAKFLPTNSNPQRHLSSWVVRSMKQSAVGPSRNLSHVFVVLRVTLPLLSYLQTVQSARENSVLESSPVHTQLRTHVLFRSPTAYGLQYFATSSNFVHDESGQETPAKLLARFEILVARRAEKLMWVVRPAIEEFNSYIRPSYTSKALREKLSQEVFKRQSPLWLSLDGGAACPSDKPEQLMSAIHDTIVSWVKDAVQPETANSQPGANANKSASNDQSSDPKPAKSTLAMPSKQPQTQQRPNSTQRPQQVTGQQRLQNMNSNRNQAPRPEFITLD